MFIALLEEKYRDFQITGGMPEAVQSWIYTKSIENIEKIQTQIIMSYENDFAVIRILEFEKMAE